MLVTEGNPPSPETVIEAVRGGANVVQIRHCSEKVAFPGPSEQRIKEESLGLAILIANGYSLSYFDVMDWDGWHIPEAPLVNDYKAVRICMGPKRIVGRSIHSPDRASEFEREGADYLIAGTIFQSKSHPDVEPHGLEFLDEVCRAVRIPVIAIGGITPENAPNCISVGAAGVAVLSPIMRAENPREVAGRYAEALGINHPLR